MTDREKIVKIIRNMDSQSDTLDAITLGDIRRIADALIAAGIGDVKSWEISDADKEQSSINYYCEMREWKDKCKEAQRRAEVAERALSWLCDETMHDIQIIVYPNIGKQVRDKQELYDYCIKQAEKELQEEREYD